MARSFCPSCRRMFSSISSFDLHRAGSFRDRSRHCLEQLEQLGLEQKGGIWGFPGQNPIWEKAEKAEMPQKPL